MQINNKEDAFEFFELVQQYIEYLHVIESHRPTVVKQSACDLRREAAEEAGLSVDQVADFDRLDFRPIAEQAMSIIDVPEDVAALLRRIFPARN